MAGRSHSHRVKFICRGIFVRVNTAAKFRRQTLFDKQSLSFLVINNLFPVNAKCLANFLCYTFCEKESLLV